LDASTAERAEVTLPPTLRSVRLARRLFGGAPRFSVLLPTHNRAHVLRCAIASVLAQTDGDFELLVVGDGCRDNTGEVVARFSDARIRWFDLPKAPHFGYANRNTVLRQARGAYIAYVTDDDLIFPDHLALLAATLEKSGAEWAYSRPLWVTDEGFVVPFASNLFNRDELEIFLTLRNHIPSTCVMHRRSCLDKYGYWPEDVPSAGDWRYWITIIEGGARANFDYCPVPSVLHFNADWRKTAEQQAPQPRAGLALARAASWWPATLKCPMASGASKQQIFFDLIQGGGFISRLRDDVTRVIERMAWNAIDEEAARPRMAEGAQKRVGEGEGQ
jgi:glycosyltransferase involved in cell wall biosynthesis